MYHRQLSSQSFISTVTSTAIDGSKFKAVNNRDRNFTSAKLQRRMEEIESSISRYLTALDTADRQEPDVAKAKTDRLQDKITALKAQMKILKEMRKCNSTKRLTSRFP